MTYVIRENDAGFLRAVGSRNVNLSKTKQHGLYAREDSKGKRK
jgi:hypothetical protein